MYWQNSKFRSDFAEKIQVAIQSSRMICNSTAIEIENSIFRACQHDSDVYFQQIYDLTIYIRKHKNNEHLTQDVINNPTEALKKFIDNARILVAEPRVSSVAPKRILPVANAPILPRAQTSVIPAAQIRRLSSTQTRVSSPAETRVSLASQPRKISRTEPRILPAAEPRSNSTSQDSFLSELDHYNLLRAQLLSKRPPSCESFGLFQRPSTIANHNQYFNTVFQCVKLQIQIEKKLEDRSCSAVCYKEFQKVGKMLRKTPSTDSNCKMCMNRSSIAVPANAVLYSCGHNFLCHGCATSYWNKGKACGCDGCLINSKVVCPICRKAIKDVIKSYSPL